MSLLNCKTAETKDLGKGQIQLLLGPITDEEYPTVSIVTPTYNRKDFAKLMVRNFRKINYPREKLEWIIVDDSETEETKDAIEVLLPKEHPNIKIVRIGYHMDIGKKRNFLGMLASNDYVVHMDDDDFYPETSVAARIRVLLQHEKKIGYPGLVGCSKVNCYDLIGNQVFEAFDEGPGGLPTTISESTFAYNREFFKEQQFKNEDNRAECLNFIKNRHEKVCIMPSGFVITQFSHNSNTVNRRVNISSETGTEFTDRLAAGDSTLVDDLRASIIIKFPVWRKAVDFASSCHEYGSKQVKKIFKNLDNPKSRHYDEELLKNQIMISVRQEKLVTKKKSSGKDIVYYCGPGLHLKFTTKWNPKSKTIGGSEEAVINLSNHFAKKGYNVTVYCVLKGPAQYYGHVKYRPYWEWIPGNKQDVTIFWRDPSLIGSVNSTKVFLDLHDAIKPEWVAEVPESVNIMTKSNFHSKILSLEGPNINTVPNGIGKSYENPTIEGKQKNLLICTSSPDRCITGLLLALPLIREKIPDAEIHWAYGFESGQNGGLLNDPRKEVRDWVTNTQDLMKKTEGFLDLGRLRQEEVFELYKKAEYYVYGTKFPEIDCISLTKAMACGCVSLVTPSGAMAEKTDRGTEEYSELRGKLDYSLTKGPEFYEWVNDIINTMENKQGHENLRKKYYDKTKKYSWDIISKKWIDLF